MKRITITLALTMLAALVASPLLAAGVPQTINLQGRFTDAAGNNVADGVHTVAFKIWREPVAGALLWSETLPVQVTDGLFTVVIGNSTPIPATLFTLSANRYLGVTVDLEPEMPRIPLNSVAYAYQTEHADEATLAVNLTCVGCVSAGEISANAVGSAEIATDAVGSAEIAPGAVVGGLGGDIADGAITSDDLGANSVFADEIADGSVGALEIATDAVGSAEIAPGAVVGGLGGDIADGSITADDLGANSVFADEIADGSVGALEIANSAVGSAEIAVGAVTSSDVLDGNLQAVDMDDEPGVASDADAFVIFDGTIQNLLSRTITAPAAGHVLVIATALVGVTHTIGTTDQGIFGVSTTNGAFLPDLTQSVAIPSTAPTGGYIQTVTVHALFPVSGGADAFFFVGQEVVGVLYLTDLQLTLIYFPTAYGTVVSTAAVPGGEIISSESADLPQRTVLPETGSLAALTAGGEPVQAQVSDPAGIQQELAQVKADNADMEARIRKLEELLRQNQSEAKEKR